MRPALLAIVLVLIAAAARGGTAKCWFENGAVVVPAAFGDVAGDFLLDLSAPASELHQTNAASAGMTGVSARARIKIAGLRTAPVILAITDLDGRGRPFTAGLTGVIGADVLAPYVVEITTDPCAVTLTHERRPSWPGAFRLPLRRIGGAPAVRAAVSDGAASGSGWFAIDTAAYGVRVSAAAYARTPAPRDDPRLEPPARLRALSLGGLLFENLPAWVAPDAKPSLAGAIGEAVWSRYRLRIGRRWLELEKP
jgi:hypothetical protein